jgi:hypothetical protein
MQTSLEKGTRGVKTNAEKPATYGRTEVVG